MSPYKNVTYVPSCTDIEKFHGNMDQITGKIQKAYGHTKEQAEAEFNEFKALLEQKTDSLKEEIEDGARAAGKTMETKFKQAEHFVKSKISGSNAKLDKGDVTAKIVKPLEMNTPRAESVPQK